MKRAQIDAFCGCRETLYQRIAFFAAPAILLAGIVYVAVRYAQLPAEIPSHYNFYGEIDGYGSRGTLWIMPVVGILCDALMLAVSFFPQTWNCRHERDGVQPCAGIPARARSHCRYTPFDSGDVHRDCRLADGARADLPVGDGRADRRMLHRAARAVFCAAGNEKIKV